ncbi:MAG: mandelate racemase/muconate lactonizing enzyme family protein [Bryobacterales bacterium]|nr:mandelate racemase/muconate lactonizing enzyme family protein [Bryobacterales bacterium]
MKIAKIEARPFRMPRDMQAATGTAGTPTLLAKGNGDYRWSDVFPALYSVNFETALIKITLDNGVYGWGEAQAPLAPEVACEIVRLLLAPALEGAAFDGSREEIEALWDRMYSTMRVRGQTGGFMLDAISGVDTALWDIAGKLAGMPVYAMLGGARRGVPAYVSGLPAASRRLTAEKYLGEGFAKFKLFFDVPETRDFLRALDELPADAQIAVDALWRLTPQNCVTFGRELDARQALWLEAPLPPEDAAAHATLAGQIHTPVAIGESYRTRFEMRPFFDRQALRVYQPDLGRCGITEGLRLAAMAAERGVAVVPHISIAMGPQIAAAIHFGAAVEACSLTEYNPQVLAVANRYLHDPLRMEGNAYSLPDRPGLGVDLRLE